MYRRVLNLLKLKKKARTNHVTRIVTLAQYQQIVNSGADYCDCCGGLYELAGLYDNPAMMPDFEHPLAGGGYPLVGGFTVCRLCADHCEDGPCQPDRVVTVQEEGEAN
jgi:hypothetical protein